MTKQTEGGGRETDTEHTPPFTDLDTLCSAPAAAVTPAPILCYLGFALWGWRVPKKRAAARRWVFNF